MTSSQQISPVLETTIKRWKRSVELMDLSEDILAVDVFQSFSLNVSAKLCREYRLSCYLKYDSLCNCAVVMNIHFILRHYAIHNIPQ